MDRPVRPLAMALVIIVAIVIVGAGLFTLASPPQERDTLYQIGSLDDLVDGRLDGTASVGSMLDHGDIGLGTFNGLDGEMIVIDGRCYRAAADGSVSEMPSGQLTPFAQISRFDRDGSVSITEGMNYSGVKSLLETSLPSLTVFYLLRIDGTFNVTVRSVPGQTAPYPPLEDVIANQTVFQYQDVAGTLVGLWSPDSSAGLSSSGFHFHFISQDRSKGGHVLDLQLEDVTAYWDSTASYDVDLN
ncbi:MAG: acetolactate decarboxylase [Methanomassiliicoccus sp.]|nr:acetolactate decarboxylase [Methanomassiliicoccus sp.]